MSTVVVTGAGGSLGQRVVALLAARPDVDRVVAIDAGHDAGQPNGKVRYLELDLANGVGADRGRLDAGLAGASAVVHLAWWNPPLTPSGHAMPAAGRSANLRSMRQVLDAASRTGVERVVHLSSATVYGAWPDNPVPLAEDAVLRPNPGFVFAAEKAEAERMAIEWAGSAPDSGLAVLRPAVTVGAADPALYGTIGVAATARSDDASRPMQFLHIDDLASAIVAVWRSGRDGVFNVSPDGWIGEDTARTLTGGVAWLTPPGRLVRMLSTWGWALLRTGTPKEAVPYTVHPWVVANDRLVGTGWEPLHTNEEALVTADSRGHWSDLPAGRRRALILTASAGVLAAAGFGVAAAFIRRRRRV